MGSGGQPAGWLARRRKLSPGLGTSLYALERPDARDWTEQQSLGLERRQRSDKWLVSNSSQWTGRLSGSREIGGRGFHGKNGMAVSGDGSFLIRKYGPKQRRARSSGQLLAGLRDCCGGRRHTLCLCG